MWSKHVVHHVESDCKRRINTCCLSCTVITAFVYLFFILINYIDLGVFVNVNPPTLK